MSGSGGAEVGVKSHKGLICGAAGGGGEIDEDQRPPGANFCIASQDAEQLFIIRCEN